MAVHKEHGFEVPDADSYVSISDMFVVLDG
jgi:hypothetical protein